jgi:hypothetical protein
MTLAKAVTFFAVDLSRFPPKYFTWIFLPADLICLVLQAAGGAMSNSKKSAKIQQTGLDISKAGLILQVVVLVLFIAAFVDFFVRYYRSGRMMTLNWRIKAFVSGLFSSIFIILVRCVYRVVELREGYHGEMMKHEAPFIALEGAAVVLAAACLLFCHPGMVFQEQQRVPSRSKESDSEGSATYKGPHVTTQTHNV